MRTVTITSNIPSSKDLETVLKNQFPACEVKPGWGPLDWTLVKQSFFIGARVSIIKKKKCIHIRRGYGSRNVVFFLPILLLIDLINFFKKGQLVADVTSFLKEEYGS